MAPCSGIQHCVGIQLSGMTRGVLRERKGLAEILLWFHFKATLPGADSGGRESAPLLHFVTQLTTGCMTPRRFLQINKQTFHVGSIWYANKGGHSKRQEQKYIYRGCGTEYKMHSPMAMARWRWLAGEGRRGMVCSKLRTEDGVVTVPQEIASEFCR